MKDWKGRDRMKLVEFFQKKSIAESSQMLTNLYIQGHIDKNKLAELIIQAGEINANKLSPSDDN